MEVFSISKTPEEIAAQERSKHARQRRENFQRTPKGMARSAWEAKRKVWQFLEVISETTGKVVPMIGTYTADEHGSIGQSGHAALLGQETYTADERGPIDLQKSKGRAQGSPIEQIESEGWTLANAGYVFQETGSVSRDKFLSSGQQEAVSGRILGIYIFRRTNRPDDWSAGFD